MGARSGNTRTAHRAGEARVTRLLFRFRGELLAAWGICATILLWPPSGCIWSLPLLLAGISLRLWARRHIGPHSRGRNLSCPERSVAGPYRFVRHPLYAANLLVILSLALSLAEPGWKTAVAMIGPACLYAALAHAESRFVAASGAPTRNSAHDRISGKWRSEWASTLPQIGSWIALQILARP